MVIRPSVGSKSPRIRLTIVVFPAPLLPVMMVFLANLSKSSSTITFVGCILSSNDWNKIIKFIIKNFAGKILFPRALGAKFVRAVSPSPRLKSTPTATFWDHEGLAILQNSALAVQALQGLISLRRLARPQQPGELAEDKLHLGGEAALGAQPPLLSQRPALSGPLCKTDATSR